MNQEKRILLAEAMGYRTVKTSCSPGNTFFKWEGITPDGDHTWRLPEFFTDANDDYAVLEWMRSAQEQNGDVFYVRGRICDLATRRETYPQWEYSIGDYARAALRMIGDD